MPLAVEHIRRMRGGAQAHLMRCDDGACYVVKFQNNPQHVRVLANEMLGTRLAARMGLPVPRVEVVEVTGELIALTADLVMQLGVGRAPCRAGRQPVAIEAALARVVDGNTLRWAAKPAPRCASSLRNGVPAGSIRSARKLSQMTITTRGPDALVIMAPPVQFAVPFSAYSKIAKLRRRWDSACAR